MKKRPTTTTSGLRLSKRELFRNIGYAPHAGQVLVHRSRAARRVLACGVRWGKSTALAMEIVAALLTPAQESLGWIVSPTFDITDLIFVRVRAVLEQHFALRIIELAPKERRIVVRNLGGGVSEVRGKSAETASSLLGVGLDWVVIDEAARIKASIWEQHLSQRLVDRSGWALTASTPRGTGNWFYREWRRGQKGGDPDYESWSAPSADNPLLDPTVIAHERKRLLPELFEQEYEGKFLGIENEPCLTCIGPTGNGPGGYIFHEEAVIGRCPDCRDALMPNGKTMVRRFPSGFRECAVVVTHKMSATEHRKKLAAAS